MPGFLTWTLRIAAGAALLLVLVAGAIFLRSEQILRTTYDVPLERFVAPRDAASIAEGERKAHILGCYQGCHGTEPGFEGRLLDESELGRVYAPNLTRVAARESDAEIERTLRHGVRQDGTAVWEMPVDMFQHLSNEDLGEVIAFLRSRPLSEGPSQTIEPNIFWRWQMVKGEYTPYAPELAQSSQHVLRPPATEPRALGRYLAMSVCSECHGQDLHGAHRPGGAADLVMVAAYSLPAFTRLMRTGVPVSGRQLRLMDRVALSRFSHFTDAEIAAVHDYLGARARGEVE